MKEQQIDPRLVEIYENEKKKFPPLKILFIVLQMCVFFLIHLMKGSGKTASLLSIKQCSSLYWILYVLYIPVAIVSTVMIARWLCSQFQKKKNLHYKFQKGDLNLEESFSSVSKICLICAGSGLFSSLFGIGGGVILNPLLMNVFNMPVVVANYTVSVMCVVTGGSSFFQYFIHGALNIQYALVGAFFSVLG